MSETRIVIPADPRKPGLFSYVNIWEPKINKKTHKSEGYSLALVWSKKDKVTTKMVREAIDAAIEEGNAGKFDGKKMSEKMIDKFLDSDDYPLHDGDEKDDEILEGMWYMNCRSKNSRPGVVDEDVNEIQDQKLLYSGCFGVISATFYAYNFEGKLGIGVSVNNVQVLKQGPKLGADSKKPSEEFKSVVIDDDDDDRPARKKKRVDDDDDDDDDRPVKKKKKSNDFLD